MRRPLQAEPVILGRCFRQLLIFSRPTLRRVHLRRLQLMLQFLGVGQQRTPLEEVPEAAELRMPLVHGLQLFGYRIFALPGRLDLPVQHMNRGTHGFLIPRGCRVTFTLSLIRGKVIA